MIEVLQGDCMELMKGLPDIDAIITDPPYGINYKSGHQRYDGRQTGKSIKIRDADYFGEILNDDELPLLWLPLAYDCLKDGGAMYIFCHWSVWGQLERAVSCTGFRVKNMIVMSKSNHGMGDLKGSYAPKHELVLFATKGRHLLRFNRGRDADVIPAIIPYSGAYKPHPNYKPGSWVRGFILNSSPETGLMLDPFCGSGSFLLEARKLNRNAIGIELDHKHYITAINAVNEIERQPIMM